MKTTVLCIVLLLVLPLGIALCPVSENKLIAERTPKYLISPNYPGTYGVYGTRLSCAWVIAAGQMYDDVVIQIQVHNSSMEPATGCWRDSVEVIDGSRNFQAPLIEWCGSKWPTKTISSTGREVLVIFNTDFKDNDYYGFFIAYWVAKKPLIIVEMHPWTSVNYILMAFSVVILTSIPGSLFVIFLIREVKPRIMMLREKKNN